MPVGCHMLNLNKLAYVISYVFMHNIVLHISIYLFPWLHVLYDISPIINDINF